MRREVVGRAAGRRGHQHAVADELVEAHHAVDADADLGRLPALAQQRDLVDGQRVVRLAVHRPGEHAQGVQLHPLGPGETRLQVVLAVLVHQEADRAAVHAVDRHAAVHEPVQRLQHQAVAAESDNDVSLLRRHAAVAGLEAGESLLRLRVVGGDEADGLVARLGQGDIPLHGRV